VSVIWWPVAFVLVGACGDSDEGQVRGQGLRLQRDGLHHAGEERARQAAELAKESSSEISDEDRKRSEELPKRIVECTTRVANEAAKKAAASGW
jgi:hypothetical protein